MKRKRQKPIAPDDPFVSCGECSPTGWVTVYEKHATGASLHMKRCRCWLVHQAKIQCEATAT